MKTFQQVFCLSFVASDAIIEVSIKSKKWLLCCTYNPNKSLTENHLRQLQKQLEASSERSDHFLIMGDFNADVSDPSVTSFCTLFKLKSTVNEPTCYKNPENPSCIDLFLTNCARSFHNTCLYEIGLSDFHKLVVTILQTSFEPLPSKIIKSEITKILTKMNSDFYSKNV